MSIYKNKLSAEYLNKIIFVALIFAINHRSYAQIVDTLNWKEDIKYLKKCITEKHANIYHTTKKDELDYKFEQIINNLDKLETTDKLITISEIMASIGDAHTWFDFRENNLIPFHYLPLTIEWFEDGLFIINAAEKYKNSIGKKLISINKVPIESIINKVSQVGYRENEFTTKFSIPRFLPILEVLKYYKFIWNNKIILEFENNTSSSIAIEDCLAEPLRYNYSTEKNPLYLRNKHKKFYVTEINKDRLYIQINECRDDNEKTLALFSEEILNLIDKTKYKSILLDLRNNTGGNSKLVLPFIYVLQSYNQKTPEGMLFVATGRSTLSASVVFCNEIKKFCKAHFIGEPTGAKANLYGENSYFISLPNSKIKISFSSEYFQAAGPFNKQDFIATDIFKPLTSEDFFKGKDPILDFILSTPKNYLEFESIFQNSIKDKKYSEAIDLLNTFMQKSENKFVDHEQLIRRTANKLMTDSTKQYAKLFYDINLKIYPNRTLPNLALGEFYFNDQDYDTAFFYYSKAKDILNYDKTIYAAYRFRLEDNIASNLNKILKKKNNK